MLAIKTCKSRGKIVGLLPWEILLERGAVAHTTLTTFEENMRNSQNIIPAKFNPTKVIPSLEFA